NGGFLKNGFAVSYPRTVGTRRPDYSQILVLTMIGIKKPLFTSSAHLLITVLLVTPMPTQKPRKNSHQ
ncbi:hypothetical protein AALA24_11850, partial [Anaerovoracaceae bacterium 42-11]